MTISPVFAAILAMDAYNRGYDPGISGLSSIGAQIGNATIIREDTSTTARGVGFYG
jgi:hypothetical protein